MDIVKKPDIQKGIPRAEQRIHARNRAIQALELRLSGASYHQIAQQIGVTESRCYQYVNEELNRRAAEPAEEIRKQEVERFQRMRLAIWPRVLRGDDKAIASAIRISERLGRMLGLDAPVRIDLRTELDQLASAYGLVATDAAEVVAEAERILQDAASSNTP